MNDTVIFAIGAGTGFFVFGLSVLVLLGRAGRKIVARRNANLRRVLRDWEILQARGQAIRDWDDDFPDDTTKSVFHISANDDATAAELLLNAIHPRESRRVDDEPETFI